MTHQSLRVVRPAADPDADLACDFTIATDMARAGIREDLAAGIVTPAREVPGGIEVAFRPEAWGAVLRYVELESKCCPFLTLVARREQDHVILTVTGRPEARELISNIFSGAARKDCC